MPIMANFEDKLSLNKNTLPKAFKNALIETCDTGEFALSWLESHGYGAPSAADVLTLTALIMRREREIVKGYSQEAQNQES